MTSDVAIIGAGPAGLFAAFQCGMHGMRSVLFDPLAEIGGQCSALYPEKPIYDIPGYPSIQGGDLISRLEEQAAPFSPSYHLNQKIVSITVASPGRFVVVSDQGVEAEVGAVIVAAGGGAFGPNRPPLADLDRHEASGAVQYYVRRKQAFRGKVIVIAGGGDSAVDWAIELSGIAKQIYLVHRRDKFRAAPESLRELKSLIQIGKVILKTPFQLAKIQGLDNEIAVGIEQDGATEDIVADHLLPFYGLASTLGPVMEWDLGLRGDYIVVNPATMATSREGIYALGDVVAYEGKLKLILTAFSEAAVAAQEIYKRLHPGQAVHSEHSTTAGIRPLIPQS